MIALSINASMIWNDEMTRTMRGSLTAVRVYVHAGSVFVFFHMCSNKCLPVGVHVCTFMRDHVLVCLFTAVDECVYAGGNCVHM